MTAGWIAVTLTAYRLVVEFSVFPSRVATFLFSSSHFAPLVTNLNDCFTEKQVSINFKKLYLNHLLVAGNVSCKSNVLHEFLLRKSLRKNMKLSLQSFCDTFGYGGAKYVSQEISIRMSAKNS
jgi:hypothetical protein